MKKFLIVFFTILSLNLFAQQTVDSPRPPTPFAGGIVVGAYTNEPSIFVEGQLYWDFTNKRFRAYNGTEWYNIGGLKNIIEDLTPQLGGTLDINSQDFTSLGGYKFILDSGLDPNTVYRFSLHHGNNLDTNRIFSVEEYTQGVVSTLLNVGYDTTRQGTGIFYGGGAGAGGSLFLYNGAAQDTDVDYWGLKANSIGQFEINYDNTPIFSIDDLTKEFSLGNYVFNNQQTVGLAQDNYVLTYDQFTNKIGLEAASGNDNLGNHRASQNLDMNNRQILDTPVVANTAGNLQLQSKGFVNLVSENGVNVNIDNGNNFNDETNQIAWKLQKNSDAINGVLLNIRENGEVVLPNTEIADITAAGAKSPITLEYFNANVSSNNIDYVRVTDSTYTLLEADILASKPHLIEAFRADGTTPADSVIITYPSITHNNSLLVTSFIPKNGSAIKVIPDTGVNDYRSGVQKEYTLKSGHYGLVSISSDAQDVIYPSSADWTVTDYVIATPPPSNELFQGNSAADNHGEVDGTTGWAAVGQITITSDTTDPQTGANHITITNTDAGGTGDRAQFEITVENGSQYEIRIWGREAVGTEGRIQLFAGVSGWSTVQLTNTWTEYVQTVTATSTTMTMRFYPNSNGTASSDAIYIDNISVIKL